MMNKRFLIICCIFIASLVATSSYACSTICLDKDGEIVVGKNFDWTTDDALIIVNKRNVFKTAHVKLNQAEEIPISWTSKYGNVTFNPWGREFPFSGINETGLVVSAMGLSSTIYPDPDERPAIISTQWIQYQLDNAATVEDVIASDAELRINDDATIHFFACDITGTCATIEFLDGKLVYHTKKTLPVKALVNKTYKSCIEYWEKDEIPTPDPGENVARFIRAANMLDDYDPVISGPAFEYIFNILLNMRWGRFATFGTHWSIAYDIMNRRINFHTLTNESIRHLDISSLDFSCLAPVRTLEVQGDLSGDVSGNFIDYTYEDNRDLIATSYADWDVPDYVIDAIASYPETTKCVGACENDGDCDRGTCTDNVCVAEGAGQIDKCTVKAGKNGKGDSLKFSGMLGASNADFTTAMGNNIIVTIEADDIPDIDIATFVFPINEDSFKKGIYKSPKIKSADKTAPVTSLQIDAAKGKMKFSGKNLDLTGLSCPITISIQVGDPVTEIVLDEEIINGPKKPCPPELMEGI